MQTSKMKFFNIDLHISVIADIADIFLNLGHSVDINYLSSHSWVFGKTVCNSFCINQSNWMNIDDEMCDRFYEENRKKLDEYDAFIVTHIPALSLLYRRFNKPIIFVASTRYEHPFTFDSDKWNKFNSFIQESNMIHTVANNLYDKWYCEQFVKKEFTHIPSLCEYTKSKYSGKNGKHLLSSRSIDIDHPEIVNKNKIGRYTWDFLSGFKSIIHFPYNASTMTIFENYTSCIPMFFPSKDLIFSISKKGAAMSEISYAQVFGRLGKSAVNFLGQIDPNDYSSDSLILKSIEMSDFYSEDMKETMLFDSPEELLYKIKHTDFSRKSEMMKLHNIERKQEVYKKWKKIIDNI